jgi:zinc transport system substrate-binding protein
MRPTRREFVGGAAALAAGSAGCLGDGAGEGQDDAAYAAFFTLEAFAGAVAGDVLTVENPIPVGELGHHYEVSTQAQLDVARSRAFVYVDLEGFQRWAVDTAANLRTDHPAVALVDAVADVDLLDAGGEGHREADGDEEEHDGDGGHDHGDVDPHFWLDPARAATCVETVRDGLAAADADNEDAYESNAADYLERLSALDEAFREGLADRERATVVVASHNSFRYLAERYDFEVRSPVGVSPNAEPSSAEIREAVDLVDELEIDTVLYDAFESPDLAETVVADSSAEEAVPLSPVAGTTEAWHERGWGYVEQMNEINLPALEAALKAA